MYFSCNKEGIGLFHFKKLCILALGSKKTEHSVYIYIYLTSKRTLQSKQKNKYVSQNSKLKTFIKLQYNSHINFNFMTKLNSSLVKMDRKVVAGLILLDVSVRERRLVTFIFI